MRCAQLLSAPSVLLKQRKNTNLSFYVPERFVDFSQTTSSSPTARSKQTKAVLINQSRTLLFSHSSSRDVKPVKEDKKREQVPEMALMTLLHSFLKLAVGGNHTVTTCDSSISHYQFYQLSLLPAIVLILLFASTTTRRQRLMNFLGGRPGLIFPMDTLTRHSRISYCCAFGATAFLVYEILLEQKFAIDYTGPVSLVALIAILTMFVYGMVFFPVFACLALGSAFSFGLGSLYVWMFFAVDIYQITECDLTVKGRAVMLARALPSLCCLAYLSVTLPMRCVASCYRKQFFTGPEEKIWETVADIKESYQGIYVRELLKKQEHKTEQVGVLNNVKTKMAGVLSRWIYHKKPGFRYPSRLVSVLFVGACVVYVTTVEFLVTFVDIFDRILDNLANRIDVIGWEKMADESPRVTSQRTLLQIVSHYVFILKACTIVSILTACVLTFLNILHMVSSFRSNLISMYKGIFKVIPPPSEKRAVWLCSGSIKFAGFQVAYIVWAYIILCLILFIISIIVALLTDDGAEWLLIIILDFWPSIAIATVLLIIQMLLSKYVFLQGLGQYLLLDNRHVYFIFAYFMFFYNIFLGILSCLLRIFKAILIGSFFLARLDTSTLPRKFEYFDPGLSAYIGYIHMEAAHTNPVAIVFIRLLASLSRERSRGRNSADTSVDLSDSSLSTNSDDSVTAESNTEENRLASVNVAIRFRWLVLYTLLQNPQVRVYRKGYDQAMKKAQKEGLRIPISDTPIAAIDLAQLQKDRERSDTPSIISSVGDSFVSDSGQDMSFSLSTPTSIEILEPMNEDGFVYLEEPADEMVTTSETTDESCVYQRIPAKENKTSPGIAGDSHDLDGGIDLGDGVLSGFDVSVETSSCRQLN
ncbi:hypothetical protein RRG08_026783 [Elysia crispata]|uniref:Receptor for retinol uptake STRA6 n=1 Tax=Elysia crispata TaxID=231223 RepID=A0AAE1E384_9GAST|nr:hypothetical protein RRG08_026783 [Elysia crispata]